MYRTPIYRKPRFTAEVSFRSNFAVNRGFTVLSLASEHEYTFQKKYRQTLKLVKESRDQTQ